MTDRRIGVAAVALVLVMAAGCTRSSAPPSKVPEPPEASDQVGGSIPVTAGNPDHRGSDPQTGSPVPESAAPQFAPISVACAPMTRREGYEFLASLSSGNAKVYLPLTAGVAREIFKFEGSGVAVWWPALRPTDFRTAAWRHLTVEPQADGTTLLTLSHIEDRWDSGSSTKFELTCLPDSNTGTSQWRLTRIGGSAWDDPPPELPGQDGPLTEELALSLFAAEMKTFGTMRMGMYTTMAEYTLGRDQARQNAGAPMAVSRPLPEARWPGVGTHIQVVPTDQEVVKIGVWYNDADRVTGEKLEFYRDAGGTLWRISRHTIGGQWVRSQDVTPEPVTRDGTFLGLRPGMSQKDVDALLPSDPAERQEVLDARGMTLAWSGDLLASIKAKSGATRRGVRVGDDGWSILSLYGPDGTGQEWYSFGDRQVVVRFHSAPGSDLIDEIAFQWEK